MITEIGKVVFKIIESVHQDGANKYGFPDIFLEKNFPLQRTKLIIGQSSGIFTNTELSIAAFLEKLRQRFWRIIGLISVKNQSYTYFPANIFLKKIDRSFVIKDFVDERNFAE